MKLQFDYSDSDLAVLERPIDQELEGDDAFEDPEFFNDRYESSVFDESYESSREADWFNGSMV